MSTEKLGGWTGDGAMECGRELPGVPPNPLPFWMSFPLFYKLPVPSVMPRGALFMHTGRMGETVRPRPHTPLLNESTPVP